MEDGQKTVLQVEENVWSRLHIWTLGNNSQFSSVQKAWDGWRGEQTVLPGKRGCCMFQNLSPKSNLIGKEWDPSFVPINLEGKRKNRWSSHVQARDASSSYNHEILKSLIKIYVLSVQKCTWKHILAKCAPDLGAEDLLKVIHGLPSELATIYPHGCFKARLLGLGHPIQSPWDSIIAIPLTLAPGVGS